MRRGPGRPPGKKRLVLMGRKPIDKGYSDDVSSKRKRAMPNRLNDSITYISKDQDGVDTPSLKRPRGRPPLVGRGRSSRSGRTHSSKSSTKAYHMDSEDFFMKTSLLPPVDKNASENVSNLTKKILQWLMVHDPQSISDISRALFPDGSISLEQIQAILDILQVLGLISVLVASSDSKQPTSTTARHSNRLYCMRNLVKGTDANFEFSDIFQDIQKKNDEAAIVEARISKYKVYMHI